MKNQIRWWLELRTSEHIVYNKRRLRLVFMKGFVARFEEESMDLELT
jgi:hypothetical protein